MGHYGEKGAHGKCREFEPITGVWGGTPSEVQGQSPSLRSGGEKLAKPLKLEALETFERIGVKRRWKKRTKGNEFI